VTQSQHNDQLTTQIEMRYLTATPLDGLISLLSILGSYQGSFEVLVSIAKTLPVIPYHTLKVVAGLHLANEHY